MSASKEHIVDVDAFLVSKTDTKGRITYCNEPFLKIVGAKQNELLGKPHNIIRHPDMPRIVFKLLWEYASLDANKNIVGYYSVRRKPNPKAIEIIEPIYKKLLELEKTGGMEASSKALFELLEQKHTTYDELVNNLQRL